MSEEAPQSIVTAFIEIRESIFTGSINGEEFLRFFFVSGAAWAFSRVNQIAGSDIPQDQKFPLFKELEQDINQFIHYAGEQLEELAKNAPAQG